MLKVNKAMFVKADLNDMLNKINKLIKRVVVDHHITWRTCYDLKLDMQIPILEWDYENSGMYILGDAIINKDIIDNGVIDAVYIRELCEQVLNDPDIHPLMLTIKAMAKQIIEYR